MMRSALLFLSLFPALAPAAELGSKPVDVAIPKGAQQSYQLPLKAGDYISVEVRPQNTIVEATVLAPDGRKLWHNGEQAETLKIQFHADAAGVYVLRLGSPHAAADGRMSIRIAERLGFNEKVRFLPSDDEEPLARSVSELKTRIQKGGARAVDAFWRELAIQKTPLTEPDPADKRRTLATFFWKGSAATKNVAIGIWPQSHFALDDYRMHRLGHADVWYKTISLRSDMRLLYHLAPNIPERLNKKNRPRFFAAEQADPFNPSFRTVDPGESKPSKHQRESILEMPQAPPQPWIQKQTETPQGRVETLTFKSDALKNERLISIYLPTGYDPQASPYPLILLFDRQEYLDFVPTPTILDNLIAAKKIPPSIAVLVDFPYPQEETRSKELPCNRDFAAALQNELLPWVKQKYAISTAPKDMVIGGSSFGGLAATCAALEFPKTFQNVLSQSGSYWWTSNFGKKDADPDAELNDVARRFVAADRLPIRFYLDAGLNELDLEGHDFSILQPNRHLRDVLLAKGYEVHYHEFAGGHDYLSWRETLGEGLIALRRP